MAKSSEESEKEVRIDKIQTITFCWGEKIVKIGPVDLEIFLAQI